MSVDLKSVLSLPNDTCSICLDGNLVDAVADRNGHKLHRICARALALHSPKNFSCPVCKIVLNPQSVLTPLELTGSLLLNEFAERQEQQAVMQNDARFAADLAAEDFQDDFDEGDQIAHDAALAQALQTQINNGQATNKCNAISIAIGAVVAGYVAMRYFY